MLGPSIVRCLVPCLTVLAAACAERGGPRQTVEQLHHALRAEELGALDELVDFRFRLREMLEEVWDAGSSTDRADAIELARGLFVATTERLWKTHYEGRRVTTWIARKEPGGHVWVESRAEGGSSPPLTWSYRLTRSERGWRVTQREYAMGQARSDTSAFYPMALRRLGKEFGRMPTLAELNANLPSLVGRMKARRIKIPELSSPPGRTGR